MLEQLKHSPYSSGNEALLGERILHPEGNCRGTTRRIIDRLRAYGYIAEKDSMFPAWRVRHVRHGYACLLVRASPTEWIVTQTADWLQQGEDAVIPRLIRQFLSERHTPRRLAVGDEQDEPFFPQPSQRVEREFEQAVRDAIAQWEAE